MDLDQEVKQFDESLRKERREFPVETIQRLIEMKPGVRRTLLAITVLPALIRMANRCMLGRWKSAHNPPSEGVIVIVHSAGGFICGWFAAGHWWTRDTSGGKQEIRVDEYRVIEGSLAEPWHENARYDRKAE